MKSEPRDMHNGYIQPGLTKNHEYSTPGPGSGEEEDNRSSDDPGVSNGDAKIPVKVCRKLQRVRPISTTPFSFFSYRILQGPILSDWLRKRKLIIHLDIRNTILVADSVTNVAVEEALNSFLTGVVWGQEVDGEWRWHSSTPSLKAPGPGLCTYYKYLERKLVKKIDNRLSLRLQTGDFTHTPLGKRFQEHFNLHLARLAWECDVDRDKVLTMSGRDGKPYHYIIPSVYKLLHYLTEQKRDFAVVIRTYGRDATNVLSSLNYGLKGNHPAFKRPLNLKVHTNPGLIKRDANKFELKTFKMNEGHEIQQILNHERDIYRFLCESQGIIGFVDDFVYWQSKNYDHAAGKPLWIDTLDDRHHHIVFDDNFRADDEDSIIDVRWFSKKNPRTADSLGHSEIAGLENTCLVQADLLESIADEDYFIRMINICEKNYAIKIRSGLL